MPLTPDFIRTEIENQAYQISIHADDERIADGLTLLQVEMALKNCEIIESYPEDLRGKAALRLGLYMEKPSISFAGKIGLGD